MAYFFTMLIFESNKSKKHIHNILFLQTSTILNKTQTRIASTALYDIPTLAKVAGSNDPICSIYHMIAPRRRSHNTAELCEAYLDSGFVSCLLRYLLTEGMFGCKGIWYARMINTSIRMYIGKCDWVQMCLVMIEKGTRVEDFFITLFMYIL